MAESQRARIYEAMIEIVGERGYKGVTVRGLAKLAGVSTRTCYDRFGGKEACFLSTHETISKRVLRAAAAACGGGGDADCRLRLAFGAIGLELARNPAATRLLLVEPYEVGPKAVRQLRCATRTLERRVAAILSPAPHGTELPELVIEAAVAGAERVARARLRSGLERELSSLGDSLAQWALHYRSAAAAELADLDRRFVPRDSTTELSPVPSSGTKRMGGGARSVTGDRALLLSVIACLLMGEEATAKRERLFASMSAHTRAAGPRPAFRSELTVEASIEAALALLRRLGTRHPGHVHRRSATLAYVLLAPLLGPEAVVAAIRDEVNATEPRTGRRPALVTAA